MTTKKKEDKGMVCVLPLDPAVLTDLLLEVYSRDKLLAVHDLLCDHLSGSYTTEAVH